MNDLYSKLSSMTVEEYIDFSAEIVNDLCGVYLAKKFPNVFFVSNESGVYFQLNEKMQLEFLYSEIDALTKRIKRKYC